MLRKKFDVLSRDENGFYLYEDKIYSGVAFKKKSKRTLESFKINDGIVVSAYKSPYCEAVESLIQIDITGFTEDSVTDDEDAELFNGDDLEYDLSTGSYSLLFEGEKYTGLALEFSNDNCVAEFCYSSGCLISRANWDTNGNLKSLYLEGNPVQYYEWNSAGSLMFAQLNCVKHVNRTASCVYRGRIRFNDENALISLFADKAFFSSLSQINSFNGYFPVKDIEGLLSLKGGRSIVLAGEGIDDALFDKMSISGVFLNTTEILLSGTCVRGTQRFIDSLSNNNCLINLKVKSNNRLDDGFVDELRLKQIQVDYTDSLF